MGAAQDVDLKKLLNQYHQIQQIDQTEVYGKGNLFQKHHSFEQCFEVSFIIRAQPWVNFMTRHPNIIPCYGSLIYEEEAYCGEGIIQRLFYPYYHLSLEQEIIVRRQTGTSFLEAEIWFLMYQIISLGSALQKDKKAHQDIRPSTILLTKEGIIKVAPYGTFPGDFTGYEKALNFGKIAYLSPEQLAFLQLHSQNPTYDRVKSDIYSLGLTLLVCMTLQQVDDFYTFQNLSLNKENIKEALSKCVNKFSFSSTLLSFITLFLQKKAQNRPDFLCIQAILKKHQIKISSFQQFELENKLDQWSDLLLKNNEIFALLDQIDELRRNFDQLRIPIRIKTEEADIYHNDRFQYQNNFFRSNNQQMSQNYFQ